MTSATFTRDPNFGYDPWLTDKPRPIELMLAAPDAHPLAVAAAVHPLTPAPPALFDGADTIGGDIGLLPAGLNAYMSYVDNFRGFDELVARFPAGRHPVGPPWGYTSASNMSSLIATAGARPFIKWSAHFGHGPHICGPHTCGFPQADWTQWDDHGAGGQNIDRSIGTVFPAGLGGPLLVSITIFGGRAQCADMEPGAMSIAEFPHWHDTFALSGPLPKPPPKPEDIVDIAVADLNGIPHVFVTDKDGNVFYTFQPRDANGHVGTNWEGGKAGVSPAGLRLFAPAPK